MSDSASPMPDDDHPRSAFIRDVAVLQFKLLLGNLHNFLLVPATLAAASLDLVFKAGPHGSRFYRVLDWGRRADEAIGLYRALDGLRPDAASPQRDAGYAPKPPLLPPVEDRT